MKSAQRIQLALENCVSLQFELKWSFSPNYKLVLLKNGLCIKCAKRIKLAVESCVSLQFELKCFFFQIRRISCQKTRFASNVLKEYNSLLKTVFDFIFCWKLPFAHYKHVLLKNAFWIKSAQRIQLAVENCVLLHFVLKTTFCQIISISC